MHRYVWLFFTTVAFAGLCALSSASAQAPAPVEVPVAQPAPVAPAPVAQPTPVAQPAPVAPAPGPVVAGPPPYGYYPIYPPPRPRARLSRGMMITGIAILGGSYGTATLVGLTLVDDCSGGSNCRTVGGQLLVPVFGPFLAAATVEEASSIFVAWGLLQAVGAGLMIGGIIKYKNSKRQAEQDGYLVYDLPRGKTLSFDASTSARLMGPRMRLRF